MEAIGSGLLMVFQWEAITFLMLGVLIGIWMGAVPGLGGAIGLVLLLPFTFGMDPVSAFALLLSSWAAASTSGAIASVMLGIPGTAAAQATILDGYPLAKQGLAARALGASFTASAIGGVFGALILGVSLPLILPIILIFESPETFMLGMLGLTMVGTLSGKSIIKGLAAAAFGLLLAMVGFPEAQAIPRYTFGTLYLLDELPVIPVLLGLFGLPEIMELAVKEVSISRVSRDENVGGGLMDGVKDVLKHWALVIRCSLIGTYIGMLPGLGASIVGWVTYGHAMQGAKDSSKFGQGDIRGVIAPEAANNALRGGALIPTLSLGVPGSVGTAVLLGALIMLGLRPGPSMLGENLDLTMSMVWQIALSSVIATAILLAAIKQITTVAFMPGHLVVPGVVLFVYMGAWLGGVSIGAWISCTFFGVVGFIMKRSGWPRPPVILALVLGGILESSFQISMRVHQGAGWLTRPIVIGIILLIVASVFLAARRLAKQKKVEKSLEGSEGGEVNPVLSLPLAAILSLLFVWAGYESLQWPTSVRQLPLLVSIPGAVFSVLVLLGDSRALYYARRRLGGWVATLSEGSNQGMLSAASRFFFALMVMLLLTVILGQKIALPVFLGVYLWSWGGYSWLFSLSYAMGGWLLIVGFYDRIMGLVFHPSWLGQSLQGVIPRGWPDWLIF